MIRALLTICANALPPISADDPSSVSARVFRTQHPLIVVGMISIGIAGYISSAIIRRLGLLVTPWVRVR